MRIIAFDVETPNRKNNRICSIGLSLIEDDKVIWTKEYLVNPECSFDKTNILIHGIKPEDVSNAPVFPSVWKEISHFFVENLVAAHNATFDLCVLKKTLKAYEIEGPMVYYVCTMRMARHIMEGLENRQLSTVSRYYGIKLAHHNAGSDSNACAQILCRWIEEDVGIDDYTKSYLLVDSGEEYLGRKPVTPSKNTQELLALSAFLEGITCNDELTEGELAHLQRWLDEHKHLKGNYPYDRIYTTMMTAFEDGIIDSEERQALLLLFKQVYNPIDNTDCGCIEGDTIDISGRLFCITGEFNCGERKTVLEKLSAKGGISQGSVTRKTEFLIVGSKGSEMWSAGNYGTKIKKALELQEKGFPIRIIQEKDIFMEGDQ